MSAKKALIVAALLATLSGPIAANEKYHVVKMWPEAPLGWSLYQPKGVALDKSGNVYVVDNGNYRIKKFDSKGRLLTQWGSAGKGDGQFVRPWSVEVDSSGVVYVGDSRVQKFASDGQFIGEWKSEDFKSARNTPWEFALDSHGNLFVIEYAEFRISKFAPDGKLLAQWGTRGSGDGEFSGALGLAVDAYDDVYVADTWNRRVQKFDSTGKFLAKWGLGGDRGIDIAVRPSGSGDVYVASFDAIGRFSPAGELLARWETSRAAGPVSRRIAADSSGKVYLTDSMRHCVDIFDSDGKLIETWGSAGTDAGKFEEPGSIAVGPSGQVVVADAGKWWILRAPATARRVQSFDSDGRVLARWGTDYFPGFWDGLATDGSGNIYTGASNQVRKFDAEGRLVAAWGEKGSGDGQFKSGLDYVAADVSGNVYVADEGNHRVQKFSSGGRFLTKWGSKGTSEGQFTDMELIAVDGAGDICVADRPEPGQIRIQKFKPDGRFVTRWSVPGGAIKAIDLSDNVYSLSPGDSDGVIRKYDANGKLAVSFGKSGRADDELGDLWDMVMCVDASGNTYILQSGAKGCVKKFSPEGKFVGKWTWESSAGWFTPGKIGVDQAGMVYVAESASMWIQKLNPEGKLAGKFRLEQSAREGKFQMPGGVAFDASGSIYVVDSVDVDWGNPRIQKFDSKGEFITQWEKGLAEDKVQHPASIALDGSGNAYITDKKSHRVHKFDPQGKCIKEWGSKGKEDGKFDDPEGIAVDKAGNVYVCDRQNCRIQKFDSEGRFLAKWGKEGSGDGEFHFPAAVAVDQEGNVFIADSDNNRVQKFTAEGKFVTQWGDFGEGPGQFNVPLGIAVDKEGNVYVSDSHNHRIQKFAPAPSR
jgi:DNA-binding beta-propeller fold protein YncE